LEIPGTGCATSRYGKTTPLPDSLRRQIGEMLPTMAIDSLRLNGIWSVNEVIADLAHKIKRLLLLLG
jgi:hypothetical protein